MKKNISRRAYTENVNVDVFLDMYVQCASKWWPLFFFYITHIRPLGFGWYLLRTVNSWPLIPTDFPWQQLSAINLKQTKMSCWVKIQILVCSSKWKVFNTKQSVNTGGWCFGCLLRQLTCHAHLDMFLVIYYCITLYPGVTFASENGQLWLQYE